MKAAWMHLKRFDGLLTGAVFALTALGLISLLSLAPTNEFPFFQRQIMWWILGIVMLVMMSAVDFRVFRTGRAMVFSLYLASVALLGSVLVIGIPIRGVDAWLTIGRVVFQPVELAKIALVILLAKFFSKRHVEIYRIQHLAVSGLYAGIPAGLVLIQPDLGSAIVLGAVWCAVIIFSGVRIRHLAILMLAGIFVAAFAWLFLLEPYQQARITSFLNPYRDPKGAGYQMIQSMIAVGSGRFLGKGLGYGSQSHLNFLPEPETDFVFAAYAEEWGFVGVVVMIALLSTVLWRIIRIGMRASDNFSRLYTFGFAALIFTQSFIHMGMNMGALPITGITLPFVSYGGSSLVTLLLGVGIVQNIKINARREVE